MSVFNLGVVFGPTLLRAAEETLAAILDIKFNNVVIEILIENYDLIFKTQPGKAGDYLAHATQTSPPEPAPRAYYRSSRSSAGSAAAIAAAAINNTQPLMRVVTRVNYTDTGMSSSLQNIPNGANGIYQNSTSNRLKNQHQQQQQQHQIYEAKPHHNQLNHSTPSLARDVNHIIAPTRDLCIGRNNESNGAMNYLTTSSSPNSNHHLSNSQSPIHLRSGNSSLSSSIHHDQSISPMHTNNSTGNHINNRDKLHSNSSRENSHAISRTPDSVYVQLQSQRLNALNYSENNLVNPVSSVIDRINSTSSSNESVCSTSSLNHSYTRQLPVTPVSQLSSASAQLNKILQNSGVGGGPMQQTTNSTNNTLPNYMEYSNNSNTINKSSPNNYDTSQSYMPKKTQRTKDITRQRYHSPGENV